MAGIRSLKKIFPGVARGGCTQLELTETLVFQCGELIPDKAYAHHFEIKDRVHFYSRKRMFVFNCALLQV